MKPRKRSKPRKPRVWRVRMRFEHGKPSFVLPFQGLVMWPLDNRRVEIREVPKRRKARRKK